MDKINAKCRNHRMMMCNMSILTISSHIKKVRKNSIQLVDQMETFQIPKRLPINMEINQNPRNPQKVQGKNIRTSNNNRIRSFHPKRIQLKD